MYKYNPPLQVNMTDIVVTKETLKRIISDISTIAKNPLHDSGIYYHHDETNMLKGYVLIIPRDDSPYQHGNYFFTVEFPPNYPYSPPKMEYLTNNGNTRFHPNFYRNGKVCLSILNTWKGDQWTSCNTLSSVLLNVATLFTKNPFLHEPGITESHENFQDYSDIIEYQNYNVAIYGVLANKEFIKILQPIKQYFEEEIREQFAKNSPSILKKLEKKMKSKNYVYSLEVGFYKMQEKINYPNLYQKLKEYNDTL